jgi:hypothetical protein
MSTPRNDAYSPLLHELLPAIFMAVSPRDILSMMQTQWHWRREANRLARVILSTHPSLVRPMPWGLFAILLGPDETLSSWRLHASPDEPLRIPAKEQTLTWDSCLRFLWNSMTINKGLGHRDTTPEENNERTAYVKRHLLILPLTMASELAGTYCLRSVHLNPRSVAKVRALAVLETDKSRVINVINHATALLERNAPFAEIKDWLSVYDKVFFAVPCGLPIEDLLRFLQVLKERCFRNRLEWLLLSSISVHWIFHWTLDERNQARFFVDFFVTILQEDPNILELTAEHATLLQHFMRYNVLMDTSQELQESVQRIVDLIWEKDMFLIPFWSDLLDDIAEAFVS